MCQKIIQLLPLQGTFWFWVALEPPGALEERAARSFAPSSVVIGVLGGSHVAAYSLLGKLT